MVSTRLVRALGSNWFAGVVLAGFAMQSGLVAVMARLSIYDESYHLAAIRFFARTGTPFVEQTALDGPIGDVERYGSYLYHYVLGTLWSGSAGMSDDARLTLLRMVTVGMVTAGLLIYRFVFRELGASPAVANVAMLAVSLLPLLVFVAGTVNYDNQLFLLQAAFILVAVKLYRADEFNVTLWMLALVLGGLAALTKYTVIPLLVPIVVCLVVRQVLVSRHTIGRRIRDFARAPHSMIAVGRVALVLVSLAVVALVVERYGVNLVRFGTPFPACDAVHDVAVCEQYPPWARNERLDAAYADAQPSAGSALAYLSGSWILLMERYATLTGVIGADGHALTGIGPNVAGAIVTWSWPVLLVVLSIAAVWLRKIRGVFVLLLSSAGYVAVLFWQNYTDYLAMGEAVGVQARYLLPVAPVVIGLAFIGAARFLSTGTPTGTWVRLVAVGAMLLVATQGGGVSTFVHDSDARWLRAGGGVARTHEALTSVVDRLIVSDEIVRDPRG